MIFEMCTVCEVIKKLDVDSLEYLSWITAIVGGILTLTTIIFTHYNERSIERLNEQSDMIQSTIIQFQSDKDRIPYSQVIERYNRIINILANNHIYETTLKFFKRILYALATLWAIGSLGYALNSTSWIEKLFIITSSGILIIVFTYIPDIIRDFNKNKVQFSCSFNDSLSFFKYEQILNDGDIIANLIKPSISVKLDVNSKIHIGYKQKLEIDNYFVILKFTIETKENNAVIYISFNIDSPKQLTRYLTPLDSGHLFNGLFAAIKQTKNKGQAYIYNNITSEKISFNLEKELTKDGEIIVQFKSIQNDTNILVDGIFNEKQSCIKYNNGKTEKSYPIIKVIESI